MERRSEIAEQIAEKRAEVRQLVITIEHVDATIREFQPEADLENIDNKGTRPETWASRGEALKEILNIMRLTGRPMGVAEIGKEVMQQRGISRKDKRMIRVINKRVSATLRAQRDQGRVSPIDSTGSEKLWEIVGG